MPRDGDGVLGIDAAWTDGEPSGVALLQYRGSKWECLRVAPSYLAFCGEFTWEDRISGAPIDAPAVLELSTQLLGGRAPIAVAIDMPLATKAIVGRRRADSEVSRRFGHRKCSVHSPLPTRPGETGRRLHQQFADAGFSLALTREAATPALLEVYPHVALLGLTGRCERLPYKVSKAGKYWPRTTSAVRKQRLHDEWSAIVGKLREVADGIELRLPAVPENHKFSFLKRFEDAIDGLVCAWMAVQFLEQSAVSLGDETAAIWIPSSAMPFAKEAHAS